MGRVWGALEVAKTRELAAGKRAFRWNGPVVSILATCAQATVDFRALPKLTLKQRKRQMLALAEAIDALIARLKSSPIPVNRPLVEELGARFDLYDVVSSVLERWFVDDYLREGDPDSKRSLLSFDVVEAISAKLPSTLGVFRAMSTRIKRAAAQEDGPARTRDGRAESNFVALQVRSMFELLELDAVDAPTARTMNAWLGDDVYTAKTVAGLAGSSKEGRGGPKIKRA